MSRFLSWLGSLFVELKRRRIYHVASVYAVVAWVVLQVAKLLVDALFLPPASLTALLVLVLLGFPLAMVFTWLYDLTPEGMERTSGAEDTPPGVRRGVLAVLLGATVLATAAAGWASWRVWLGPSTAVGSTSSGESESADVRLDPTRIAVLYFDDLSPDQDLTHVAHGLTEALTHELSQVEQLDVVSRTAVKPFRNTDMNLDSIARTLRAGSLVEGSVERIDDRLRATVQLVDGRTATHLMSRQVERSGDDLLALRDEIVREATGLLRQNLGEEIRLERSRSATDDPRAWAAYHRGQQLKEDAEELRMDGDTALANRLLLQTDSLLAQAERLDPDWIQPTLARGSTAILRARPTFSVADVDTVALLEGMAHARRALDRDPEDADALHLRGTLRYFLSQAPGSGEALREAEEDLRAAVTEDPSLTRAWARLSYVLYRQGRYEQAHWAARKAREVDAVLNIDPFPPDDPTLAWLFATLAFERGELEEAWRLSDEGLQRFPDAASLHAVQLNLLAATATTAEDASRAWQAVEVIDERFPEGIYWNGRLRVATVLARAGLRDSARTLIRRVETREAEPSAWTHYYAAWAMLEFGEEDEAVHHLRRLVALDPQKRQALAREWIWDPLRDHPGFQEIVESDGPGGG